MRKGLFISLEGIDGCGKTTQAYLLKDSLTSQGFHVVLIEDPWGTRIGESIRDVFSEGETCRMCAESQVLLIFAAMVQCLHEVIRPALSEGQIVICERFTDGTVCYNGCGHGIDQSLIYAIDKVSLGSTHPNLTILFDLPTGEALKRILESGKPGWPEGDGDFYERVRKGYLDIARKEPHRMKIIDASKDIDEIFSRVCRTVYDEMNPT